MSLELLARRWGSYAERLVLDRKGSYAERLVPRLPIPLPPLPPLDCYPECYQFESSEPDGGWR